MEKLSHQISKIESSPTLALNEKAKHLQKEGAAIINLGIGEPLNEFPENVLTYTQKILASRRIKYGPTGGLVTLKKAIQAYTKTYYGRTPKLNNITITVGAKQALFNTLYALVNPGEEVILLSPYWVSYPQMVKLVHGKSVIVETNNQFAPDIEAIITAVTPNTKAVIINTPNNPTGAVYPPEMIAALVDYCESKDIYLIMDDIYHQLIFDSAQWVPGYVFTSQEINKSNLIIVNGLSKTYGMTGFRIGWVLGPETIINAVEKVQSHTTSGASVLLQEAALGAFDGGDQTLHDLKQLIQTNRDILVEELQKIRGLKLTIPKGTFYCFPDFRAFEEDSQKLASLLLEKAYLATVPGTAFGKEGFLRLSYSCSTNEIQESVKRIRWAIDPDASNEIIIGGKNKICDWERKRIG